MEHQGISRKQLNAEQEACVRRSEYWKGLKYASQWTREGPQRGPESEPLPDEEGPILGETWEIISSTPEIDQVFERFARQLGTLIEFDRIAINVIN